MPKRYPVWSAVKDKMDTDIGGNGPIDIADVTGLQSALDAKSDTGHGHAIGDVTNLQATLDGKAAASHTHGIANVTGLQAALDAKSAVGHTHAIGDTTGLQAALDGKSAVAHGHVIADVTGLQTALDGKAASSHTHVIADVTGLQSSLDAKAATGAVGGSGLTMNTARLLGRTTASAGAIEELSVGAGLSLVAGVLSATGGTDPSGYTTIVKSANQDVTNAGVTNDTEFSFATVANGVYAVTMDLYVSGNNTSADYTMDFRVDAGTMRGKGTVQNLTAAAAVQNVIMTAAAAANTTAIATGAPTADLNDVVAVRVAFACSVTNATTFRFRFGNATPTIGATSRTWKGSVFRYKSLL